MKQGNGEWGLCPQGQTMDNAIEAIVRRYASEMERAVDEGKLLEIQMSIEATVAAVRMGLPVPEEVLEDSARRLVLAAYNLGREAGRTEDAN